MNYKKIYNDIIENRKLNPFVGYTENHHIIPRCLGGTNEVANMVRLTAREHFICHMLLTKIYQNDKFVLPKMIRAITMMFCTSSNQERYIPSRQYEHIKILFADLQSKAQSGSGNSQFGTFWISNPELKISKKLSKNKEIPEGWFKGRMDFTKNRVKEDKIKKDKLAEEHLAKIKMYNEYYLIYNDLGFMEFVALTGYDKSKPNLTQQFKKYVSSYIPQNGKRRGIKRTSPL